jgi:hypothetical protein
VKLAALLVMIYVAVFIAYCERAYQRFLAAVSPKSVTKRAAGLAVASNLLLPPVGPESLENTQTVVRSERIESACNSD